jgi:Ca2+-binding RTX toxin-like protein
VGTGSGDDTGADTITGYDTANDKLTIVATGVVNFTHGTDTGFGSAGDVATNGIASTVNVTANELAATAFYFDFDTAANVYMSTAAVDMVVNMASLKTSGVAYTLTSDTAMEAVINYNLTGSGAANVITGGGLNDTIVGGSGADTITGGGGDDTITGTSGDADVYVISTTNGTDSYTAVINEDTFDLTSSANVIDGTYAEIAITNDTGTILTAKTLSSANTTLYVIDSDATQLGTNIAATIADFTNMTQVAAFLELGDGFVSSNTLGKIDYFLINDNNINTKAYLYKFVDGAGNTTLSAGELTLIADITSDAGVMDVNESTRS